MNVESILIISFSHIGDVVLSTAVIPPLQQFFPNAKINILVGPKASDILWGDIRFSKIIIYDNKGQHSNISGLLGLIRELKNMKFDLAINLRDSLWANLIAKKNWNIPLIKRFSPDYRKMHAVDRYLDILQSHDIDISSGFPKIHLLDYENQQASEFLAHNKIYNNDLIIGIHPGGSWKYKLWPVRRFSALGDFLAQEFGAKVLIFAGPDEVDLQLQMAETMKTNPVVVQNVNLRILSALIKRCHLYIGNDTGPMHIASAVGTRVVSLFGSTDANRSGPYGNGHVVISNKLDCSPCHPGKHPGGCKRGTCLAMESIQFDQVASVIGKILNEQKQWHITC